MSKPDPIELKKNAIRTKLLFVAVLVGLVGVSSVLMQMRPAQSPEPSKKPSQRTPRISFEKERALVSQLNSDVQEKSGEVLGITKKYIDDTESKVKKSTSELIYSTVIKPIIDRVESLPEDQQNSIRENLCKVSTKAGP